MWLANVMEKFFVTLIYNKSVRMARQNCDYTHTHTRKQKVCFSRFALSMFPSLSLYNHVSYYLSHLCIPLSALHAVLVWLVFIS